MHQKCQSNFIVFEDRQEFGVRKKQKPLSVPTVWDLPHVSDKAYDAAGPSQRDWPEAIFSADGGSCWI
jgi:hypothetical protein